MVVFSVCPPHEWECKSGTVRCINADYLCDDDNDCSDGSDEENCPGAK